MYITLITLFLILGIFLYLNKKRKSFLKKTYAEKFVNDLEALNYFKYTSQLDYLNVKKYFIENFDPQGELCTQWDEKKGFSKDYRYYLCAGENIFEQGGIPELLKELMPAFSKMNFYCNVKNNFEVWDEKNEWLNHRITINEVEYIIFYNFKGYGWGEAPYKIAQILNNELEKQNIDERCYLINGGNDGRLALLTHDQYQLIYKTYTDKKWKPLQINEWAKEFDVTI
ncbi:hypothetical protein [Acinetobacter ursingii]|uniref:hypothetical protein n=1 Tax=Acinetobacter ursingii TaxID=108980 RepID=UPI00125019D5|nr:hypothetical protein [Acinetobacter ursingii]